MVTSATERQRLVIGWVRRVALLAATFGLCVHAAPPLPHAAHAYAAEPDDGLPPFRRVLLSPDQLAVEMERVRRGVLRQLPCDEFEDLVRRAAEAHDEAHN